MNVKVEEGHPYNSYAEIKKRKTKKKKYIQNGRAGNNVEDNVDDNVEDNVGNNVDDNVEDNVGNNVDYNVDDNVGNNVDDNVDNNVDDNVKNRLSPKNNEKSNPRHKKKNTSKSPICDGRKKDIEFHTLYESDEKNNMVSRRSSVESIGEEKDMKADVKKNDINYKVKLNTLMLQSYLHKSYDKVSNILKKTSQTFMKKSLSYETEKVDDKTGNNIQNNNNEKNETHGNINYDQDDFVQNFNKIFNNMIENPTNDLSEEEKKFFEQNSQCINKMLHENASCQKNKKEKILKKYKKKIIENKDISSLYDKFKELLDERTLLFKLIIYYKNINYNYKQHIDKIQHSYDILISENEQLNLNNITLKKHIDLFRKGDNIKRDDNEYVK
ncbi:hypothetical protein PFFVO_04840 [Plasmodium falciparum Vietnam Oak-Knoll (FVO)]|uniref:Uncharacterized protein n=1 Tax=Plasmodium falciparum Vietnam Oak-Knoll (FVO) TaxID=1036723 RepID=A0A024V179_PLAFA|nr:hypothetical protein PFFVO_04840 [Plasmodium falciparum Vietnam Oak-Knoll (FVO)]